MPGALEAIRRVLICILVGIIMVASGAGAWAGYLQLTGNVHEVEPGLVFRSNQLGTAQMAALLHDKRVRTVLNLRGGTLADDWYRAEVATVQAAGATLIDLPLSDKEELSDTVLARLISTLRAAPEPLLIHCQAGADRSGLASALFELIVAKRPVDVAASQLSFAYGHFPWFGSRTAAMNRTFWRVAARPQDFSLPPGAAS